MKWQDDDIDAPQDIDLEDDGGIDFEECPNCGKSIPESSMRCPHCGRWLSEDTVAATRSRGWYWPAVVAILIAIILIIWNSL
jgi:hypothetical protein